jgi:hypothetical protein
MEFSNADFSTVPDRVLNTAADNLKDAFCQTSTGASKFVESAATAASDSMFARLEIAGWS